MLGNYKVTKSFLLSQEGFFCIELVIYKYVGHVTALSREYPKLMGFKVTENFESFNEKVKIINLDYCENYT